jgi:hypothetical protein
VSRLTRRGASVVAIWAGLNALLAALLFVFSAHDELQERAFYWSAVAILVVTSAVLFLAPTRPVRSAPTPGGGRSANGAPSASFAAACLVGGLAWVFGVFLAYFALPLVAFVLARWRVEWAERKRGEL